MQYPKNDPNFHEYVLICHEEKRDDSTNASTIADAKIGDGIQFHAGFVRTKYTIYFFYYTSIFSQKTLRLVEIAFVLKPSSQIFRIKENKKKKTRRLLKIRYDRLS